ncbi:MAG TPA: hypothetical protein DDZ81_02570 [Acetobacteraceae bacterium]|jgi:hypothetical protein|nr:hypothetical protein [Acetobacteraceae bacterium]
MGNVQPGPTALRGLSFSIADLILIGSWSEAIGVRMAVRLDHGSDTEEFEEVLAFHTKAGHPCRFIMWRDEDAVHVQPLIGRTRRYESAAAALAGLAPRQIVVVTDVKATRWPDLGSTGAGPD